MTPVSPQSAAFLQTFQQSINIIPSLTQTNKQTSKRTHALPRTVSHLISHLLVPALSALQCFVSGDHLIIKLDHECGALVPVDGDLGGEAAVGEDGLYDPSSEGCTVQAAVLLRDGDECVDEGLFFDDVVGLVIVIGLLQLVCLLTEQGSPHGYLWRGGCRQRSTLEL